MLRFREPETGVEVALVGAVHFNPASVALAASTVREAAARGRLGGLVLETCPQRWASTLKLQPPGSLLRALLDNEFQAADDARAGAPEPEAGCRPGGPEQEGEGERGRQWRKGVSGGEVAAAALNAPCPNSCAPLLSSPLCPLPPLSSASTVPESPR